MGLKRTGEFRKDAVRIALTSGLTRKQVADDLGVGMSTLNKWLRDPRYAPDPEVIEGVAADTLCFLPVEIVDRAENDKPSRR